ncbi:MAG: Stp1/IreP family PP2C-type Ser/Thr phosphatase [Proteobacteria bacterium]|nr:Stp1/IreP family PP2C-type Ser/Thr phosphatase [Burkholderiales bacterium]
MVSSTDPGMVRSHNEDSLAVEPQIGLAVLADGMGGYNAGEVASGIAVALIREEVKKALLEDDTLARDEPGVTARAERILREQSTKANASIFQSAQKQPQYAGMGTTLVTALFSDNRVTVAHIGDSRLYRLRGDSFEQITRDHSLLQEQIDSGMISKEDARHSMNKNLVTRALGVDPEVETEIHTYEVLPGDTYLLCSDGLSDMIPEAEIHSTIETLKANLQLAADQLVQTANDYGGRDNVSVVLVQVNDRFASETGWVSRFMSWLK